jgi:hypothetical protein
VQVGSYADSHFYLTILNTSAYVKFFQGSQLLVVVVVVVVIVIASFF